jgi:NADH:ubiquinone oxidoreductase subunit 5 (subunit L)/multisubunit Na+/H+ antiporter MnhA subunit
MDQISLPFKGELSYVAFLCFAAAAFAKAGAMPFHSWVPDCGEKAPASVTAFLPASLDKLLGIYLLARIATGMFKMNMAMSTFLMIVGATTVICAVMMALVQHDLKRLLSYHAVSQVGYMVLGIGTGTVIGIAGALFHMLNNAVYKSCLFLCAGSVEKQAGTTDLDKLGGMSKTMPLTFICCLVAALAISGIPPLNGFASKWMVYQGIIETKGTGGLWVIWLVTAMLGSALTLASFVKVLHATFLRKPSPAMEKRLVKESPFTMLVPMLILAALCILFGVLAWRIPLKHFIFPAVAQMLNRSVEQVWRPGWGAGPATILLASAFVSGILIYMATIRKKVRVCRTYTGGEILSEPYIAGEPRGSDRDVEVSGVDFYETVEHMQPFRTIYRLAKEKVFDLYDAATGIIFYFVKPLRKAHAGLLPVYLTWFLVGFLAVLWILVFGMKLT